MERWSDDSYYLQNGNNYQAIQYNAACISCEISVKL
jgi:hypothetical protein